MKNTGSWRFCNLNTSYEFCPTYPSFFVVPAAVTDDSLREAAEFRSKARIPVLSWLSPSGTPIVRGSQPLVGLTRMHSTADQSLLRQYIFSASSTRLVVCDSRPKVNAAANAAIGGNPLFSFSFFFFSLYISLINIFLLGGWEDAESYPFCAVEFFAIENIHAVREAFAEFRSLISVADGKTVDASTSRKLDWSKINLQILNGAVRVYQLIESKVLFCPSIFLVLDWLLISSSSSSYYLFLPNQNAVFVHCSDGWDRTAQITSLAELMLDPYYRSIVGFIVLVEKEWMSFGHQFARRFGHGEDRLNFSDSQRSPIFVQWLECVWNMVARYPDLFEFTEGLLEYLLHHVYSCRFGTFLTSSEKERREKRIREKTPSIWSIVLFHRDSFTNRTYAPGELPINPFASVKTWSAYSRLGAWTHEMLSV